MVQPKYSPEEALQRIKLMMEYDSSKTYTENKVIVENKQPINRNSISCPRYELVVWNLGWSGNNCWRCSSRKCSCGVFECLS